MRSGHRKKVSNVKLPACDPCRFSKLACDHAQPICARCEDKGQTAACIYRLRPFKKKKPRGGNGGSSNVQAASYNHSISHSTTSLALVKKTRYYPNPGYLGSSSYTTVFEHLSSGQDSGNHDQHMDQTTQNGHNDIRISDDRLAQGAKLLEQLRTSATILSWASIVEVWTAKGINLALANSFTTQCTHSVQHLLQGLVTGKVDNMELSEILCLQSCNPLSISADGSLDDFCALFCGIKPRWETLGLFFTAVSRATIDIPGPNDMPEVDSVQPGLQRLTMRFSDGCLDIALSLDCLNDLQLVLQYENFILHSLVDGDQSYHSWRGLGDVASSIFALGYHENVGSETSCPAFLRDLRREAFDRAYSADKNVSIFLGRPHRIHRADCTIAQRWRAWPAQSNFDYTADTRWHAICAVLKEDILLLRKEDHLTKVHKARVIRTDVEAQWAALPVEFRLEKPLMTYERRPAELDFMVSSRLNYMHVMFLLHSSLSSRLPQPSAELLTISADMLSLVVEAVLLRHRLANSGTSLVWKVAYYGLVSAGVVCLALLNDTFLTLDTSLSGSKAIRDLSVLAAEVENGALVQLEDPNYALLSRASHAIKSLLDRVITDIFSHRAGTDTPTDSIPHDPPVFADKDWSTWIDPAFWENL